MFEKILLDGAIWLVGAAILAVAAVFRAIGAWKLIRVVENGNATRVRFWLRLLDADSRDRGGRTALLIACESKNHVVAECLLTHGASPNIPPAPIFVAVEDGNTKLVQLLVKYRALLNLTARDDQGISKSVLVVAILAGDTGIVEILLKNGAQADEQAAMSLAISKRRPEIVRLLLTHGATVDGAWESGMSYLSDAVFSRDREIVDVLCKSAGESAATATLCAAALMRDSSKIKAPIKSGIDINSRGNLAFTPLACVARINNAEMVRDLLNHGAEVNARSADGCTALMEAVRFAGADMESRLETVRLLIKSGADMRIKDEEGKTALFHACGVSNCDDAGLEIATLLIRAGADVNAADNRNCTILMNAFEHCAEGTARLLIERGAVEDN